MSDDKQVGGMNYQPRYVQFARVRGFEPGAPDAPMMYEFINWIRRKWNQWAKANNRSTYSLTEQNHAAFDEWLAKESE